MSENDRAFAVVRCAGDSIPGQPSCGDVELTLEQYSYQMDRPHQGWGCPHCGSSADYLDAPSERLQGIATDDDDDEEPPR